jgi:lipopolysaccharide transport system permease protein
MLPVLVLLMGMLGLGLGMIISSMVTKYRDLTFLVSFGVQLLMYMSAVMYPLDLMKDKLVNLEKGTDYSWIIEYNPMAHIVEMARFMILNDGIVTNFGIVYTSCVSIFILLIGVVIFNKTEKNFIDTI